MQKKLAPIFPTSKTVCATKATDPMKECVASAAHKKKSVNKIKAAKLTVILLPPSTGEVPKPNGIVYQQLVIQKRVLQISFKRTMIQHEVRNHLIYHFKHHRLCLWEHMDLSGGILVRSSNQNPDGDIVERKQLYVREQVSIPCGAEC